MISPLGVALALVRDVVERTIVVADADDLVRIRREATDASSRRRGAAIASRSTVEIDPLAQSRARHRLGRDRARRRHRRAAVRRERPPPAAAQSLRCEPAELERIDLTLALAAYLRRMRIRRSFGRVRDVTDLRIVDERGVVRLALRDARSSPPQSAMRKPRFAVRSSGPRASATSDARSRRCISCGARASRRSTDSPMRIKRSRWRRKNSRAATRASASRF